MQAITYNAANGLRVETVALPYFKGLPQGYARIKVLRAGICRTDIEITKGYVAGYDSILGHEFVGLVEEIEPDFSRHDAELSSQVDCCCKVGDRVVADINIQCSALAPGTEYAEAPSPGNTDDNPALGHQIKGLCASCIVGGSHARNHCLNRRCIGIRGYSGVFCEQIVLPLHNLHVVPESVPTALAVFAEPLAAALRIAEQVPNILNKGRRRPPADATCRLSCSPACERDAGSRIVVIGDGKLGLLITEALYIRKNDRDDVALYVIGRHMEKLRHVSSRVNAISLPRPPQAALSTSPACSTAESFSQELFTVGGPLEGFRSWFDVCIEASGNPQGITLATELCRPEGLLILKTTASGDGFFQTHSIVVKELTVKGSRCGPVGKAIELLASGKLQHLMNWASAVYPLSAGREAFHAAEKELKVHLVCSS